MQQQQHAGAGQGLQKPTPSVGSTQHLHLENRICYANKPSRNDHFIDNVVITSKYTAVFGHLKFAVGVRSVVHSPIPVPLPPLRPVLFSRDFPSRYTALNFIPLFLWEQFTRFANFYFLVVCVLQMIPSIR